MSLKSLKDFVHRCGQNKWLTRLWYGVSVVIFIAGCVTLAIGTTRLVKMSAEPTIEGNNAVSYYFTVHTTIMEYSEIQANYAAASKKLQTEILHAINYGSSEHRHKRSIRSKPDSLTILGMSPSAGTAGIIVMCGFMFSGRNAPDASSLQKAINGLPQTTLLNLIGDEDANTRLNSSPLCSTVNGGLPNATKTLLMTTSSTRKTTTAKTTTPSSTATTKVDSTPYSTNTVVPTTSIPSCVTTNTVLPTTSIVTESIMTTPSISKTTTTKTTASSSTVTTTLEPTPPSTSAMKSTTPPYELSCNPVDVIISFDTSQSSGKRNFVKQTEFVRNDLSANWTISENATEVALTANNQKYFNETNVTFKYPNNQDFHRYLRHFSCYPLEEGEGSIVEQLAGIKMKLRYNRQRVRRVALLFTYTSFYDDVKRAVEAIGNDNMMPKIVIVAMGNSVDVDLLKAITGSVIGADQFDEELALEINGEICSPQTPRSSLPASAPTTSVPPSSMPTTESIPRTTRYPMPGTPNTTVVFCMPNVVLIMDASNATGTTDIHQQTDFVEQMLVSTWFVGEDEDVWLDIYASGLEDYRSGSHRFRYSNNTEVYDDLRAMSSAGSFGDNCIDCSINLATKSSEFITMEVTTVIFTYASNEPDISFARQDRVALKRAAYGKVIIVGIGENVNGTALQNITRNVVLSNELDQTLAAKISEEICSRDRDTPPSSDRLRTLKHSRQHSRNSRGRV